eukprot:TRINITY_DN23595_c1_g1_i2.p1 TRINITY_DN23595_c1_g1~~TRINITY_DN23595_c1_g1_i2.p1  ORF type:complete len:376 (+),score=51.91 TRINITY_DN23595_c1_g1_i2:115-1242(+)
MHCRGPPLGAVTAAAVAAAALVFMPRAYRRRSGAVHGPGQRAGPVRAPPALHRPPPPGGGSVASAARPQPRLPPGFAPRNRSSNATTAVCITGAIRQGHEEFEASFLVASAQRFDPSPDMFAYVGYCDNPNPGYPGHGWYGNRSTGCRDLSNSSFVRIVVPELRTLRFYWPEEVVPPPSRCPDAWPPKRVARYYSQHLGWRRCFELVQEEERARGQRYSWVIKMRADLVAHRDPQPEVTEHLIRHWVYKVARPVSELDDRFMYVPVNFGQEVVHVERPFFVNDWMFVVPRKMADVVFGSLADQYLRCDAASEWEDAKRGMDWETFQHDGRWWYPNDLPAEVVLGKHLRDSGVPMRPLYLPAPRRTRTKNRRKVTR